MTAQVPPPVTTAPAQGPEPAELRRALLTVPATVTAVAVVVVAVVSVVLDGHHVAAAVSALVAGAVVVLASTVTGVLGVRSAAARPEAVFAAAMVSFMTKVLVFAVALVVIGSVDGARRVPFAVAAITAVLAWLAVEVVLVARLRSTGAAVFGPPVPTGSPASAEAEPGRGPTGGDGEEPAGPVGTPDRSPSGAPSDYRSGPPVG